MAVEISTSRVIVEVAGRNVPMELVIFDDGGAVYRNPHNKNMWFAQVAGNPNWNIDRASIFNLQQYYRAQTGQPLSLTDANNFFYTQATTNQPNGGVFNQQRAAALMRQYNNGTLTKAQIYQMGLNGVAGLTVDGKISTGIWDPNKSRYKWITIATTSVVSTASTTGQAPPAPTAQPENLGDGMPAATRTVAGSRVTYRYPLKQPPKEFGYDYIKITAMEYMAPGLDVITKPGGGAYGDSQRRSGDKFETVILPMQPSISESNATAWGDDEMNAIQGALGRTATGGIKAFADLMGGNWSKAGDEVKDTFKGLGNQFKYVTDQNSGLKQFIIAYFAGQAAGGINIMGRQYGQVINPNLELLFSGPQLRTFNFNFIFTPREIDEAKVIKNIIRCFKRNMAPQRTSANLFLKSPRVFDLQYIYKDGGQHPYLDTFKVCALQKFNVDYTPGGSYATYRDGGSMTQYKVQMSFKELNPIYADEYKAGSPGMLGDGPPGDGTGFHVAHRSKGGGASSSSTEG